MHFYLPCVENAVFSDITKAFEGKIFATELNGKSIFKENLKGPVAFIFGNEGSGLQSETIGLTSHSIRIPMEMGIESLNVSAAVSICLYEKYRQENLRRRPFQKINEEIAYACCFSESSSHLNSAASNSLFNIPNCSLNLIISL